MVVLVPDTTKECCNTETFADSGEGEDVAADPVIVIDDAVLVGPITALLPELARHVK